jgi:hypothetical protein
MQAQNATMTLINSDLNLRLERLRDALNCYDGLVVSLEWVNANIDIKTSSYEVFHLRVFLVSISCALKRL